MERLGGILATGEVLAGPFLAKTRNTSPVLTCNDLHMVPECLSGPDQLNQLIPIGIHTTDVALITRRPTIDECRQEITLATPIPKQTATRSQRYAERETLRWLTGIKRHIGCGRWRLPNRDVQLRLRLNDDGKPIAHYSGLQACGSIWTCPVCAPKIRQQRAIEADAACVEWLTHHGVGSLLLLTLTLPHDAGEALAEILASTRRAFSALVSGRAWQVDKRAFGLRYYIRAHDVTVGPNGWHPHLHLLFFLDTALTSDALGQLRHRLFERWAHAVASLDRRAPTREHGVRLEAASSRADAARYVCQVVLGEAENATPVAYELARGDLKISQHPGHRTPWQVLHDYGESFHEPDRRLWLEYERATRRVNAIRWANGLRAAVGLTGDAATDEQVVLEEVADDVVYTFPPDQWRALRDLVGFFERSARAELLDACELGGLPAVTRYLDELSRRGALDRAERRALHLYCPGDPKCRPQLTAR